ncbi:hypothetical protein SELMODRAFT_72146, partial [Selaginella moellendorffii]
NAVLWAITQHGDLDAARKFFEQFPTTNLVSWSTLLTAYAQRGRSKDAIQLFDAMKLCEEPDEVCFVSAILACSHGGKVHAGRAWFVSMAFDFELEATKQHYCCMVDLLARGGYLDDSKELIHDMPFVPDFLEWTCLLGATRSSPRKESLREMRRAFDLEPESAASYVLVAN